MCARAGTVHQPGSLHLVVFSGSIAALHVRTRHPRPKTSVVALTWTCRGQGKCPGRYNLTGKTTITSGLRLGRSEVLRSLRHCIWAQRQGHQPHRSQGVKGRGGRKKRNRSTIFLERTRKGHRQSDLHIKTFFFQKAILEKLLRDGAKRRLAFSSAHIPF